MIRDRDRIYGAVVTHRLRAMGIRDRPTAPASPWQNGFAERLIGSIRRGCVDHIIVLGEMHLRRVLKSYADYYNLRQNASIHEQGCSGHSPNSANWEHQITGHPWRTSPPLRPSLSFRYTQVLQKHISRRISIGGLWQFSRWHVMAPKELHLAGRPVGCHAMTSDLRIGAQAAIGPAD
jgi:hypothetical protein